MAAPSLASFMTELKDRLTLHLTSHGQSKCQMPILAISETVDSFLIDSIAEGNRPFVQVWSKDFNVEAHPLTLEAFITLVTTARRLDPALQKLFDKIVPRKATEHLFWWRYFGHVHALLIRLAPTSDELLRQMLRQMPPPRTLAERHWAPKEGSLQDSGELDHDQCVSLLSGAANALTSDETVAAICDDAAAAVASGRFARLEEASAHMTLTYQLEYFESRGVERMHAAASLHPPALMKRYDFTDGAAIKHAVHAFIGACQTSQRSAVQMYRQRPSADTSTRRFQPASELASSVDAEPEKPTDAARGPEKLTEKLLELVRGLREMIEDGETVERLVTIVQTTIRDCGGAEAPGAADASQAAASDTLCRWQREWIESQGIEHMVGFRAVWTIGEAFKPQLGGTQDDPTRTNELLHAFGRLRLAMQRTISRAIPTAQPTVTKRRFAPKSGALQTSGELTREQAIAFTTQCAQMLLSDESIAMLARAPSTSAMATLSVSWQRELLEHLGIQMDFGCASLGEVPHRFADDDELLAAFDRFQLACETSAEKAANMAARQRAGKAIGTNEVEANGGVQGEANGEAKGKAMGPDEEERAVAIE